MYPSRDDCPVTAINNSYLLFILVFIYQMALEAILRARFFYFLDPGQENKNYL